MTWRSQWVPSEHEPERWWTTHDEWRPGWDHGDHAVAAAKIIMEGDPECCNPEYWAGGHMLVESPSGVVERIPLELEYEPTFIAYLHEPEKKSEPTVTPR